MQKNQKRANVFVDYRNYHYYFNKYKWNIDWTKFKTYLSSMYDINAIYFYEGVPSKAVYFDLYPSDSIQDFVKLKGGKKKEFDSLKKQGFIVRSKLVQRVYDVKGRRFKHKCNFDVELTIDAITTLDEYEVCILCSGDGDFVKLIKHLKGKHKEVIIIAGRDRLSGLLKKAANQFVYLGTIKPSIAK